MSERGRTQSLALLSAAALALAGCAETTFAVHTAKNLGVGQSSRDGSGIYKVGEPYEIGGAWYTPAEDYAYNETGIASYYGGERSGKDFHGKFTANGEIYDQNALTAAHRTLPMPSLVRVTNLENGRALVLRVNDRGPFARGRIIDVSRRSAQLLGFEGRGTARVRVEILAEESRQLKVAMLQQGQAPAQAAQSAAPAGTTVAAAPRGAVASDALPPPPGTRSAGPVASQPLPPPSASIPAGASEGPAIRGGPPVSRPASRGTGTSQPASEVAALPVPLQAAAAPTLRQVPVRPTSLYVQAGAFANYDNAKRLGIELEQFGRTQVQPISVGGQNLYRVRLGPLQNVRDADQILDRVAALAPEARVVVD
ncbi:MAG TPA: septal ring lytic transglycosylase RlpA family protein [Alphaproteobacteria bacterium]|jgi:rare lipoprotein A|nr:septal ring lytic transglycosylase RlpA family protein [Alphaproteobacteria bacterium]